MILKKIAGTLSPGGPRARLSILIFHRVLSQVDSLFPSEQDVRHFDEVLSWIARWFQVLPLDEAVLRLGAGSLPPRAAAITFDDGYADNAINALPILKSHGMTATFFIATSFLDGGRMWNDSIIESIRLFRGDVLDLRDLGLGIHCLKSIDQRRLAVDVLLGRLKYLEPLKRQETVDGVIEIAGEVLSDSIMLKSEQVLDLSNAGMHIGAHTCSHPILESATDSQAMCEIKNSKDVLESLLGKSVNFFAYPNGKPDVDFSARHVEMVRKSGFIGAVSTAPGVALQNSDVFQLPRFTPWDRTRSRFGMRLLANLRWSSPHLAESTKN